MSHAYRVLGFLLLLAGPACSMGLQFGRDLPGNVRLRVIDLLVRAGERDLVVLADGGTEPVSGVTLCCGSTPIGRQLVPDAEVARLGAEGILLRSGSIRERAVVVAAGASGGALFSTYALLAELGFGFLHPLAPVIPARLTVPVAGWQRSERPHWPLRGLHLHTMHPTELSHVLNGWGPQGPDDAAGWQSLLPEWTSFLEWMVANRQNYVQWVLLENRDWLEFSRSGRRQMRLTKLIEMAHSWGLKVGLDAPIALEQQNGFRLITRAGTLAEECAQIKTQSSWLMDTGCDVISTEMGFSEFTHPDDRRMVAWMDALTAHGAAHGRAVTVKAHVSTGQKATHYDDPVTNRPINFNFLAHHADPRLGVLVHTVQIYGLDDPAPTYGRKDFKDLHHFLRGELGRRPVIWYPETAYWVSYDIDVPVFLPVYAQRRLHDLRLLAQEKAGAAGIEGQVFFSSGWEWGYWLNDVVTARAAWDPRLSESEPQALQHLLRDVLRSASAAEVLARAAEQECRLLIYGHTGNELAEDPVETGIAYLQGVDTWDDLADFWSSIQTQPPRLSLRGVHSARRTRYYAERVRPLMEATETHYQELWVQLDGMAKENDLIRDLADAARISALRARQLLGLYDHASRIRAEDPAWRATRLKNARAALDEAAVLVALHEAHYRTAPERIAGWGTNPTAYPFGYLWPVRSLFYWWRDEGKATDRPLSPCYLNLLNPARIASAEGEDSRLFRRLDRLVKILGPAGRWVRECLHPPEVPPDLRAVVRH